MKRKKVITVIAMAMTCATIASCGKTTTETVKTEPVIQETEQIVLETEEIVQEETEEMEEENLHPTMIDGIEVHPDYPEKYVKYTPIDAVALYCTEATAIYMNPNSTKGELGLATYTEVGAQITFDATCEIDGVTYYRYKVDDGTNRYNITKADCWSETPPTADTSSNTETNIPDGWYVGEDGNLTNDYYESLPEVPEFNWDEWDPDPEIIEQMGRLTYE